MFKATSASIGIWISALSWSALTQTALAVDLVPITLPEGTNLLQRSRSVSDYGQLSQAFLTQSSLTYCGVASAVMILNSLDTKAPLADGYRGYRFWTQDNIFLMNEAQELIDPELVNRQGLTLHQLANLLSSNGVSVSKLHGDRIVLPVLRSLLRKSLSDPSDRLIVNYDRRSLGQKGGGHFSPLAAYDSVSDRVLVLDVARYRYPSVWIHTADLLKAMHTLDTTSGDYRGLLIINQ